MSRNQRLAYLAVAAVIAIVAIIALSTGGDDDSGDREQAAQPKATPTPAGGERPAGEQPAGERSAGAGGAPGPDTTPQAKPKPKPPLLQAGEERTVTVDKGDTVRFRVRHDTAEHVHVHGYDLMKDVPAGKTVTMSFEATIDGIFEIELEDSATPLGTLKVEP